MIFWQEPEHWLKVVTGTAGRHERQGVRDQYGNKSRAVTAAAVADTGNMRSSAAAGNKIGGGGN